MRFNLPEFTVAMARKFGAPIPKLLPYVGTTVRSEERSQKVRVDQYSSGVASAPGGHVSAVHNWINFDAMTQVLNSGVLANNTWNGACKGSLNVGTETWGDDNIGKNLQKMIPDGWIGRFLLDAVFQFCLLIYALARPSSVKKGHSQHSALQQGLISCHCAPMNP